MSQYNPIKGQPGYHGDFENYDLVSDPGRIASALAEINRQLVLVSVRLDSDGPLYDSHILRLDDERQRIFLGHLEPANEAPVVRPTQDLYVFATMRGIAIRFASTVLHVLDTEDGPLYESTYPEQMLYLQRRDLFRVHLPRHERRLVKIRPLDMSQEIVAQIVDLSVKGFCLEVRASEIRQEQIGKTFHYQGMSLPDSRATLSGEATLVNLRPSPTPEHLSAGFEITDLDPLTERALMRAALYFQREIRKLAN